MKHRPWLRYVHWFGYLTSCIVILQLLFLTYLGASEWARRHDLREATRMQQGPVNARLSQAYARETEVSLLNRLPALSSLSPDGFRLIAMPSFGDANFAISLHKTPRGGEGFLVLDPSSDDTGPAQTVQLKLSPAVYDELTERLDALASSWEGESGWWTDGTDIVYERVKGNSVTSGFGNSPRFYGKVGALVFNAVRPVAPELARFDSSWHPRDW
jgi:hypothetical protein